MRIYRNVQEGGAGVGSNLGAASSGGGSDGGDAGSAGGSPADAGALDGSVGDAGAGGEVPGTPTVVDFGSMVQGLPADIRNHPSLKDIKDFDGLAKSFVHSQAMIGSERLEAPKEGWTPEQFDAFYDKLGRPAKDAGYEFTKHLDPGFAEQNGPMINAMQEAMHAAGLTDRQAAQVADAYLNTVHGSQEAMQAAAESAAKQSEAVLRQEWGASYDQQLEFANEAAQKVFGENLPAFSQIRLADGSFLGDNPLMVKLLAHLGESIGEGGVHGGSGRVTLSPDEAAQQLRNLEADPELKEAWMNRDHPLHQSVINKRMQLRAMMDLEGAKARSGASYDPQL